jgi:hypothetical protein
VVATDTLTPPEGARMLGNWLVADTPFGLFGDEDFESHAPGAVTTDTLAGPAGFSGNWLVSS